VLQRGQPAARSFQSMDKKDTLLDLCCCWMSLRTNPVSVGAGLGPLLPADVMYFQGHWKVRRRVHKGGGGGGGLLRGASMR
jgi:hypothetical protein